MIDRRPALIARCAGAADVVEAVRFARRAGLELAVRGGGHNVSGNAVCQGGLVVDLSPMKGMWVDPEQRTARVEAGLTWAEVNHELQAFGLGATGGVIGTTGVSGLTLGGGLGWLARKHGLACDNLVSIDVVTANGYELVNGELRDVSDVDPSMAGAAGGQALVTTTEDLARFLNGLFAGELFEQPETLERMLTFVPAADAPDKVGYGLGIERYELPGGVEMIGHLGTGAGYRAWIGHLPAQDIDFAMVITNPDDPSPVLMPALELMGTEAAS